MEREAVLVGIDVGTSKVCALIGEVSRDGRLTIMGHGTVPASGLKKGVVINIDQTVRSIADAVEKAERLSGWKIDRAFVGVGGQHVESLNSPGQVAVTGHHREVSREDINRAIDVARAVPIPSNREVLHVERRGFSVDGQEGVKDPLGMSALRLEVETHIVTGSATAVTEPVQVRGRGRGQDRRAGGQLARLGGGGAQRDREGARRRGRRHRRRHDRPRAVPGGLAVPHPGPAGRWQQRHQRRRDRAQDVAADGRGAEGPARHVRPAVGDRRRGDQRQRARRGCRADGQPARGVPDHRGADARDVRAAAQRDPGGRRPPAAGRASS